MSSPAIFFEENGNPPFPKIVFLHGLLGSSRNWRSVCKCLSGESHSFALDLPNHGKSFHSEDTTIKGMACDILRWLDGMGFGSVVLCGHSLGGKVAMRFAIDHPERVKKLIVVDIAPRDYPPEHHAPTLDTMLALDLAKLCTKKEADLFLSKTIPNWAFRQFLLTNLGENDSGFAWNPNLRALRNSIAELSANPLDETERYDGPALFVCGGKSGYVRSEHFPSIKKHFPQSQITVLADVGHDVHVEDREGFVLAIRSFLAG